MQLTGIHHLTAVSARIGDNKNYFTQTLGMRLVKKSVNQDDTSSYHLFYADGKGSPGTDVTFFDWPMTRERRGTRTIARTGLRVRDEGSLNYWANRLTELGTKHAGITTVDGRPTLDFEDPEGQRLRLVTGGPASSPWDKSPVPAEHQILGLGPITLSVPDVKGTGLLLTMVMEMRKAREYTAPPTDGSGGDPVKVHVYEMGNGGPSAELHVAEEPKLNVGKLGAGGVHHVAFRVPTFAEYDQWNERLKSSGLGYSGPVDRFYFRSLYFREPNGILFELATDGPGFHADEPMETMGERLALPPFLEGRRGQIEAGLKPI